MTNKEKNILTHLRKNAQRINVSSRFCESSLEMYRSLLGNPIDERFIPPQRKFYFLEREKEIAFWQANKFIKSSKLKRVNPHKMLEALFVAFVFIHILYKILLPPPTILMLLLFTPLRRDRFLLSV